jgi:hypothetical protein
MQSRGIDSPEGPNEGSGNGSAEVAGKSLVERRDFLKLCGVGLAGAAIVGGGGSALAQGSGGGTLRREFEAAASEYGVPAEVLLAMGYVNTRWEMVPEGVNAYDPGESEGRGTYGIMALVRNPTTDTLGKAASLSGIPESQLKRERAANIRGGAALLAEASGVDLSGATERFSETMDGATDNLNPLDPDSVDDFQRTVTGAVDDLQASIQAVSGGLDGGMAVAGVGGGELYAGQVRDTLRTGASATIGTGERVSLAPANV